MRKSLRKHVVPRRVAKRLNAALQQSIPAETELKRWERLWLTTVSHQYDYEWSLKGRVQTYLPPNHQVMCKFQWGAFYTPKHVWVYAKPRDNNPA